MRLPELPLDDADAAAAGATFIFKFGPVFSAIGDDELDGIEHPNRVVGV
jgi:hypothetical protein